MNNKRRGCPISVYKQRCPKCDSENIEYSCDKLDRHLLLEEFIGCKDCGFWSEYAYGAYRDSDEVMKMELYTLEEMIDNESLCEYCEDDPGWHSTAGGDPVCCEGAWCEEAYNTYLDENEITDIMVRVKNKTKVTIERD